MEPCVRLIGIVFDDLIEDIGRLGEFAQLVLTLAKSKRGTFKARQQPKGLQKSPFRLTKFPTPPEGIGKVEPAFAKSGVDRQSPLIANNRGRQFPTPGKDRPKVGQGLFVVRVDF